MNIKFRNLPDFSNNNPSSSFNYYSPRGMVSSRYPTPLPSSLMNKKDEKFFMNQLRLNSDSDLQT